MYIIANAKILLTCVAVILLWLGFICITLICLYLVLQSEIQSREN